MGLGIRTMQQVFSVIGGTVHIVEYPVWDNVICGDHGFLILVLHYVTSWESWESWEGEA